MRCERGGVGSGTLSMTSVRDESGICPLEGSWVFSYLAE